jgi:dihydroflavonol-4-reductase
MLAYEHGRPGERYLLGGDDMALSEVFAVIARAAGLSPPRLPVPWSMAYAGARVADAGLRLIGREPQLLVLDEVRAGRTPHLFDDSKARAELGYVSRPGADALADAARSAIAGHESG